MAETVLQVADYGAPYSGNFIASLRTLEGRLSSAGWRMIYAFSDVAADRMWLTELREAGCTVHMLRRRDSIFRRARAIAAIASSEKASIIHTHFTTFDVAALLAGLLLRVVGRHVKVVWHVHSPWRDQPGFIRRIKDFIKWRLLGRFTFTVVVSDGGYEVMTSCGVRPNRATVIYNGIALDRVWSGDRALRKQVRDELGVPEGVVCLLAYAWDPERKGVDLLVEAMRLLNKQGTAWCLLLVGEDRVRRYLATRFEGRLPKGVLVLPPVEDPVRYYAAADIFVSASRREGFPYAVAEAMGAGLPVVSSDIAGLEWAQNAQGCKFFPTENVLALVAAINEVVRWTAGERAERISNNQSLIRNGYSAESWAEQVLQLYRRLLATE